MCPIGPKPSCSRRHGWALAAIVVVLPACMGAPIPVKPQADIESPEQFTQSGADGLLDAWWTSFGDPQLNRHTEQALAANRDLRSIWYAFVEAAAVSKRTGAARHPVLDVFADGRNVRSTESDDVEQAGFGVAAAYEVDLWGRLKANERADQFEAWARLDDYRTAAVSLTAEVARTWYRLLEAELQVAVLGEQVDANTKIRSLIEPRVATQQLRGVDLLRQDTLVESTREQRLEAEAEATVLRNQLAVLTGQAPGAIAASTAPALATLPPLPATGVPIETVRRRPDVLAAERRVMAADQELGAALRDRYPRLTLDASAGSATGVFEGFVTTFAAGLLAPIFDGGRRGAEIARSRAQRDRLRASYGQSVLVAFREVEDALVAERLQRDRLKSIERQFALTERSSSRLRDEYLNGQGSYIDVLAALTQEQELRRRILTTQRLLLEARIGLCRALATDAPRRGGVEGP